MMHGLLLAVTLLLVRHGERDLSSLDGPLTAAGQERAQKLAAKFKDAKIDAVYATTLQRTQQTVKPTADEHRLQLKIHDAKDTQGLVALLKKEQGTVLVGGHSNTLPDIAKAFGCDIGTIADSEFDFLFVVGENACIKLHQ